MTLTAAAAAALLLATSPATPATGPLADLIAAVARLPATAPVSAQVVHRFALTQGDDPPRPEGVVEALAAVGPEGLQVTWSPEVLAEADREEQRRATEPDAATPVRDALLDLRPLGLARTLDAAPDLLRTLQQAELLEVLTEEQDGVAQTVLVLKVVPVLTARERKYVKAVHGTARIRLGPDGLPASAELKALATGRIYLVIGFEVEQREAFRFARVGDRLVAVHHEFEQRSTGAGEKTRRRAVTSLTLRP